MERVLGSAGTLVLVALGLVVAAGRYEGIRLLVVIEVVFVGAMIVFGILLFSTATSRQLQQPIFPLGRRLRLERRLGACTPLCMSTAPHSVRLRLSLASP